MEVDKISEFQVECRSEFNYPGRPESIWLRGNRHYVELVLDSWRTPSGLHYRVVVENDDVFEFFYSEADDLWKIHEQ